MKSGTSKCLVLAALLFVSGEFGLHAQAYSLDWFKVSGGGGSSANGQYLLSGTIGQADASAGLRGGSYTLVGGFWSLIAVQSPGAPALNIFHTSTNTVVVAWPAPSTGFVLQQTSDLTTGTWVKVTTSPVVVGNSDEVIVSPLPGMSYYRLQK